jgi:hypothetical protein
MRPRRAAYRRLLLRPPARGRGQFAIAGEKVLPVTAAL